MTCQKLLFGLVFTHQMFFAMADFDFLIWGSASSAAANIPSATVDPELEGLMVHTNGPLSVKEDSSGVYVDETGVVFGLGAPETSARVNASTSTN